MGGFGSAVGLAAMGWLFAPVISFLLNKFLSYIYDASEKLVEMRSGTMARLKTRLGEIVEQRMLIELSKMEPKVIKLSELEALMQNLKDALYEAEDILDLVEYHRIEKEVGDLQETSWLQWCLQPLYDSTRDRSGLLLQWVKRRLCWLWQWVRMAGEKSALLLQWVKQRLCWLWPWVSIVGEKSALLLQLPRQGLLWLWGYVTRSGEDELPVTSTPSPSLVQRFSWWCSSLDFKNSCTIIFNWLIVAFLGAQYYRDWSLDAVGFTGYQQGAGIESNCTVMGPLYNRLNKNMKKIEQLIDEAQKTISFKKKLQETIEEAKQPRSNEIGTHTPSSVTTQDIPKTTADPMGKVTGRDEVCKKIRGMLRDTGTDVVGIHGIPGSGKTTLAQHVCKYEKGAGYFDPIIWIHVTQNFSVDRVYREMFEAASEEPCPNFISHNVLKQKLEQKLSGKRFLLVLDDIWCKKAVDDQRLPLLLSPFKVNGGSKVLVTGRNADALSDLGPCRYTAIPIPDLDDKDFFELFMYYALGGSRIHLVDQKELIAIGTEIAQKLKRSPLAARTVGGQLRTRQSTGFWRRVRDSSLLEHTMGALLLSYQHLDDQLKRCFAYCSIFPRRSRLFRHYVVNIWVAEGFIKTTNSEEEMKDIGQDYFDELVSNSFLQIQGNDLSAQYYYIHDLLHDLAKKVAGSDCFRIENGWQGEVPQDVRHLSFATSDASIIIDVIVKLPKLRSLTIDLQGTIISEKAVEKILMKLTMLRVLHVQSDTWGSNYMLSFPNCIGNLKHLRGLFVSSLRDQLAIITLPGSIARLYQLQGLWLDCKELTLSSDTDLFNLINLRVLKPAPLNMPNIGRMTCLRELPLFKVRKEQGYGLQELKDLNRIQQLLCIEGLEFAGSKEEALEAKLSDKKRLKSVTLAWGSDVSSNLEGQADVLDGLCPPSFLECLETRNYQGLRSPDWIRSNTNSPNYLQTLWLVNCSSLGPASEFVKYFVHLRKLILTQCNWETLPNNMENHKSLEVVRIHDCFNMRSLPALPRSLNLIDFRGCNEEFMRSCQTYGDPNWLKIKNISFVRLEERLMRWGSMEK